MSFSRIFVDYLTDLDFDSINDDLFSTDAEALFTGLRLLRNDGHFCETINAKFNSKLISILNSIVKRAENDDCLLAERELVLIKLCLEVCLKCNALELQEFDELFLDNCQLKFSLKLDVALTVIRCSRNLQFIHHCLKFIFNAVREEANRKSTAIDSEESNRLTNALFLVIRESESKQFSDYLIQEIDRFLNDVQITSIDQRKMLDFITCLMSSDVEVIDSRVMNVLATDTTIQRFILHCLSSKQNGLSRKKARFCALKAQLINFDVWLLLEALEEKQRHLIEPLLASKLNFETCESTKKIDENVLEIIIERMLSHDNKHIRRHALRFLDENIANVDYKISHQFLLETVIYHLQDNAIYSTNESNFTLDFIRLLPLNEVCDRLLRLEGRLSPIAVYHITKTISEDVEEREEERIDKLIVRKLVAVVFDICADVYVRSAIQTQLIRAIGKRCPEDAIDSLLFVNARDVNLSLAMDAKHFDRRLNRIEKRFFAKKHLENDEENVKIIARFVGIRYETFLDETVTREIDDISLRIDPSLIELFYLQMLAVVIRVEIHLWKIIKKHLNSMDLSRLSCILSRKNLRQEVKQELISFLKARLKFEEISWHNMAVICELQRKSEYVEICETLCDTIDSWLRSSHNTLFHFKDEHFWICVTFYAKCKPFVSCIEMLRRFALISSEECRDRNKVKDALFTLIAVVPINLNRYIINFYGLMLRNELRADNCDINLNNGVNDHVISDTFAPLCEQLFAACLELKKNEYCRDTFLRFITEFAFREEIFTSDDSTSFHFGHDYCYEQLTRLDIPDISASLYGHLSTILYKHSDRLKLEQYSVLLVNAVIDGMMFTRVSVNQIDSIAKEIGENENISHCLLTENALNFHHKTRLSAIKAALNLNRYELFSRLTRSLIETERQLLDEKKYSFLNSNLHRHQTKLWQFHVIMLQQLLNTDSEFMRSHLKEWTSSMFAYTVDCFISQQKSQMSVQILQQLFVITLLLNKTTAEFIWPQFYETLQLDSEGQLFNEKERKKLCNSRIGSLVPFLSIVYHLINSKPELKFFPIYCLLTCQHYKIRLLSHLVLQKVMTLIDITSNSYKFLIPPIPRGSANVNRNLNKLRADWYYSVFDAEKDITLEFLLYHLPRLTNCMDEDCIPLSLINSTNFNGEIKFSISNTKSALEKASPSLLRERFLDDITVEDQFEKSSQVFQKKYSVSPMYFSVGNEPNDDGLIVCATLLDKAPNIGGLCRTCEVFGVHKLIIENASVLTDKDFVQLSVSSQKWVTIEEVRKSELSAYLTVMRRDHGYTLIGIEQTTGSKPLNLYAFPKKSLLLLGNEKEGLPVEYLQQLNECVEIPQSGYIRSLNVHVTGAIVVWEYYKQMVANTKLITTEGQLC